MTARAVTSTFLLSKSSENEFSIKNGPYASFQEKQTLVQSLQEVSRQEHRCKNQ
jgi:hypothetical protein